MDDPAVVNSITDSNVGAVIVGFDIDFTYWKLLVVMSYVKNDSIEFIATDPDQVIYHNREVAMPGTDYCYNSDW